MSVENVSPLPPPPPPPSLAPSVSSKKKLYQALSEGRAPVEGDHEEARIIIGQRESSFRKDLQWLLFNKYVPSLIQDGPQCGLVALWMAAHLLHPPETLVMETLVQAAKHNAYTEQGEMFSASDMAKLAEEVCGCRVQRLSGGMMGENTAVILKHLAGGQPVLIPYDEDFNHEPCLRNGHKAHWAVVSGILLGLRQGCVDSKHFPPDVTLPWLHLSQNEACVSWPMEGIEEVFVLAKQGKSLRYQLWKFEVLTQSNSQLKELDPQRASDGTRYVVPLGGVQDGLAGQVLLLHTNTQMS
ncbi:actin maturation protease isoform X3 [Rhinichthys klamathensis goyatoka]|uniref:actin maturation protease isoform X3 n=1 Tax=Rhinichthys klamathensis goyatoka TaxID=3034132 RepID=UPI0024B4FE8C|nr:actin maturation protease isoform X3 [Rhinichthys klamathensis goyatoka]